MKIGILKIALCVCCLLIQQSLLNASNLDLATSYLLKNNHSKAKHYIDIALLELNKNLKDSLFAVTKIEAGRIYERVDSLNSAVRLLDEGLKVAQQLNNPYLKAKAYISLGNIYDKKKLTNKSLEYYRNARKIITDFNLTSTDINLTSLIYLGIWKFENKKFEEALNYFNIILEQNTTIENELKATLIGNKATCYYYLSNYTKASKFGEESLKYHLNSANIDSLKLFNIYTLLAGVNMEKDDTKKVEAYFSKALRLAEKSKMKNNIININSNLSLYYNEKNQLKKAERFGLKAIKLIKSSGIEKQKITVLQNLADIYLKNNNLKKSNYYLNELLTAKDNFNSSNSFKREQELVQALLRDSIELAKQKLLAEEEKRKTLEALSLSRQYQIISLAALFALISISSLFFYRYQRSKQLQAMTIANSNALIDGKEIERKRIAIQLHDSLGAMLAAAKMHFSSTKKSMDDKKYNTVDQLLNEAADEARNIAHNILPPTLLKFGLIAATEELASKMNSELVEFSVNNINNLEMPVILKENKRISMYQIIQELMNNVIKHAEATECVINFKKDHNNFSISVADNGKGLNLNAQPDSWGLGLTYIKSRIHYFNGQFSIDSVPNQGTVINITI